MKKDRKDGRVTLVPETQDDLLQLLSTPIENLMEENDITGDKELALDLHKKRNGRSRLVQVYQKRGPSSFSGRDEIKFD